MKKLTSVTIWNDATGLRISCTHSVINETTRKIEGDNIRTDMVLVSDDEIKTAQEVLSLAQAIINSEE